MLPRVTPRAGPPPPIRGHGCRQSAPLRAAPDALLLDTTALDIEGAFAAALAMGDLGVITLFGDSRNATLPLKLYQLMGSYRLADAAGAAVLLMGLSLGLFWAFDRGGRA